MSGRSSWISVPIGYQFNRRKELCLQNNASLLLEPESGRTRTPRSDLPPEIGRVHDGD